MSTPAASSVAVPPPAQPQQQQQQQQQQQHTERARASSNLSTRLRAASELQQSGAITADEKHSLHDLLLQSGSEFRERFDRARREGDLAGIRRLLAEHPRAAASELDLTVSGMTLDEFAFLDDVSDPLSGVITAEPAGGPSTSPAHMRHRQSVGFGDMHIGSSGGMTHTDAAAAAAAMTRKRQGSRSLAPQGMNKVAAASQPPPPPPPPPSLPVSAMGAPMPPGRRPSAPGDVHRAAAAAAAAVPLGQSTPKASTPRSRKGASSAGGSTPRRSAGLQEQQEDDDDDELCSGEAKSRKNERERKRRLAVTQGFDELSRLLRALEEQGPNGAVMSSSAMASAAQGEARSPPSSSAAAAAKLDKASILRNTIDRIQQMEMRVESLRKENERIQAHLGPQR